MELRQYLSILRRRWWMFALGLVVAAAAAYGFSKQQTPIYRAQATLLLNLASQPAAPTIGDVSASQALTKTYAKIVTAQPTLQEAAQRLGGNITYKSLKKVSGTDVPLTELILAAFESPDPAFAAQVVNTVSQVFAERVREAQLGGTTSTGTTAPASPPNINTVYIVEPAQVPTSPVSPRVLVNTVVGAVLGLLAAIATVALLEYLDDTVKGPEDLEALELTLMGVVQRFPHKREETIKVLSQDSGHQGLQEAYQQLRTNMEFASLDGEMRSLVVTSAQPGEGKSTTAANLAIMMARAGRKVLLVDTDLRRPSLHRLFNTLNQQGVTSVMLGAAGTTIASSSQATDVPNLRLLSSGPLPPNPSELLGSKRLDTLMQQLAETADVVIYDTPPCVVVADAAIIASHADAVLFVVDAGRTRVNAMRAALDNISRSRTRILGAVLNKVSKRGRGYHAYYYYDASHYGTQAPAPSKNGANAVKQPSARD